MIELHGEAFETFWFENPRDQVHKALLAHVEQIEQEQSHICVSNRDHAQMYSGREELGLSWSNRARRRAFNSVYDNVIKQVIDTAASIIAKNRPRMRVISKGEWTEQRKAKLLEKYLWSEFVHKKVYRKAVQAFRDACVFGTGCLKVFSRGGELCVERVLIDDIIVDECSLIDGEPREVFERRIVDADVLISEYPKHKDIINEARSQSGGNWAYTKDVPPTHVVVVEATRLPAGPKKPGRKTIALMTGVLFDEEYTKRHCGYLFYKWSEPLTGFFGQGIAEEIADIQRRLNYLNWFIQRCHDLIVSPYIFMGGNGNFKPQLANDIGSVFATGTNGPPTFFTPTALGPETYNERESLRQLGFNRIGLSILRGQGLKPAGLESGVALREYNDIEDNRFVLAAQRYEELFKDLAVVMIDVSRDIYAREGKKEATFRNKNMIEVIDWSEVDMDEDRFVLEIAASSITSMTPAGRVQAAIELRQTGAIDSGEFRYLLGNPDIDRSNEVATADFELSEWVIDKLSKGEQVIPEPFHNLQLNIKRVGQVIQLAEMQGASEEILEGFRTYLTQAQDLVEMAQPPAPVAPPGMPAMADQAAAAQGVPLQPPVGAPDLAGIPPQ